VEIITKAQLLHKVQLLTPPKELYVNHTLNLTNLLKANRSVHIVYNIFAIAIGMVCSLRLYSSRKPAMIYNRFDSKFVYGYANALKEVKGIFLIS
jgi:hypothetical protein